MSDIADRDYEPVELVQRDAAVNCPPDCPWSCRLIWNARHPDDEV